MKLTTFTLILFFAAGNLAAQNKVLKVWPEAEAAKTKNDEPNSETGWIDGKRIAEAELFVYLPEKEKNKGAAMVICPGGGYGGLAINHEGHDMAKWLSERGIAGIVLKYRLPYGKHEIPANDARQAIRIVRSNAGEWEINPAKIGIAGSSAGGHLASTAGTVFDNGNPESSNPVEQMSSRPDFMLLLYPVITFSEEYGHMGSRKNLIGEGHNHELVKKYSNELNVTPETPPTFLILPDDDKTVMTRNSVEFYLALKENNVPAEMHIFASGGHGFGMKKNNLPVDQWPDLFYSWLKSMKIID